MKNLHLLLKCLYLRLTIDKMFENGKNNNVNDFLVMNKSKFSVEGYTDEENMWQKIKKI